MKAAPHILFVCSWYPNGEAPALGNFIRMHARAAALHYRISVIYARTTEKLEAGKSTLIRKEEGQLIEYILMYGKLRSRLPIVSKLQKRDAYIKYMRMAANLAVKDSGNPDLVHVHVIWPAALSALPLIEEFNTPLVITEHWSGYLPEDGNYKGIVQKNFSKKLADKSELITVVSARMEKAMREHHLGNKFIRLNNAVDTNIFCFGGKVNSGPVRFLHVSMLVDREKNVSGLLRAFGKIRNNNCELHIIGNGNDEALMRALVNSSGTKNIFFHGYMDPETIAGKMNSCDALVMFSNFEGMPVTIIEAQCCGLPVIATNVGAIPEMIDRENGALIEPQDEAALIHTLEEFCDTARTFDKRRISSSAMARYSLQAVSEELKRIYTSILSRDAK